MFPEFGAKVVFKDLKEICRQMIPAYLITINNKEKKTDVTYFTSDTFNHLFDMFSIGFWIFTKPWSVNNGKFLLVVSPDGVSQERCYASACIDGSRHIKFLLVIIVRAVQECITQCALTCSCLTHDYYCWISFGFIFLIGTLINL